MSRGAQLPTEREWEYAARGVENWIYPWGDQSPNGSLAIFERPDLQGTDRVLSLPNGNSWVGAADMAGNIWEWTSTIYDEQRFPYPYSLRDGRDNLYLQAEFRVLRGGAWNTHAGNLRSTYRDWNKPSDAYNYYGFRCVRLLE
ncbi:MAG: formylglycine-generating enzyme family protein [Anaerolineae bacterium]|jgi:formylglycine-generating enzyme required for sulfatase activity|nr:formylglycine-generating enzyme family protein [Anaerolineae bacterium]